ncbi:tRNA guanosine(34) transglycosylase Tgt [Hyphomicrobiales bacterium]|jgi:queuine tRNA-ribosyltransferase|nr:tRNA guanosine(34) transglycosylase Tgt [Rhodobiaceae bacterium]MBT6222996.1 tRNA guanosine(34) transglycosylase Tgt [Rhodobiaceae bacterium]MDB4127968.1 tRNA guanosine(34) transglycosylase Tgt [Hyphomicrobiales bacterium]MDC0139666.1 tRNA guanosine(34) transglycosylase Tgt [Hyphomicrobiales bacterium]MDC3271915.1 tRNA guanosine(34) transglycosylase Tgt [Hyphomicrobiales bacterium]|tara:strand:- start:1564 stop:2676 length:1113 start_codon:yes stop_codon:yes gene_type:complete
MKFEINKVDNNARSGKIMLEHGVVNTPAFMPVGTSGTVKAMLTDTVKETGSEIILGNTYHLMLRPGMSVIEKAGGLNSFMNWEGPILTDSGGFQIMSLSKLCKISNDGVRFQSHIDGREFFLDSKLSMEIQNFIGSDIHMIFDQCIKYPSSYDDVKSAMELSLKWAESSKNSFFNKKGRGLFGIVQGGVDAQLRKISSKELIDISFDGYAIGGLAVGEGQELMLATLDCTLPYLPSDKPRYLMGVGTPQDIVESVTRGVDMFDCVMPTRAGRHGQAFTKNGKINIRNAKYAEDNRPLDEESDCEASNAYSRSYLHHLFKSKEILGAMLLSWSNISYYQHLMQDLRFAINEGNLVETVNNMYDNWIKKNNI